MNRRNLLFVCSKNQWRSPTAEKIWARHPGCNVRSAGTSRQARRTVSNRDIDWADIIFAMEQKHKQQLLAYFRRPMLHKALYVLDIPDDYRYMDQELVERLQYSVTALIPELAE